jgi:hypothetical protein
MKTENLIKAAKIVLQMCKNGAMVGSIKIDKLTDMQKSELSFRISQALDVLDNEPSAISDVEKH